MNILTDEEIKAALDKVSCYLEDMDIAYSRAIEAAVLSKLAEQSGVAPFGYLCDWGNDGYGLQRVAVYYGEPGSASLDDWNGSPKVHKNLPIFTEAQLIAAQQKAAEACAKACEDEIGNTPNDQRMIAAIDCAAMIRNGEWREYL